jgi:hypothetical protein
MGCYVRQRGYCCLDITVEPFNCFAGREQTSADAGFMGCLGRQNVQLLTVLLANVTLWMEAACYSKLWRPRQQLSLELFTREEVQRIKLDCPDAQIDEFHRALEYVVDRRYLKSVIVLRRYAQVSCFAPMRLN